MRNSVLHRSSYDLLDPVLLILRNSGAGGIAVAEDFALRIAGPEMKLKASSSAEGLAGSGFDEGMAGRIDSTNDKEIGIVGTLVGSVFGVVRL